MNSQPITHPEMVRTLVKRGESIVASLTPATADLWHAATGVSGETGEIMEAVLGSAFSEEIDRANMVEELGDLEFYLEQMRQNRGIERDETIIAVDGHNGNLVVSATFLTIAGAALLDQAKKVAIYNKAVPREAFIEVLSQLEIHLAAVRQFSGVPRDEALAGNIAKLSVRYQGLQYSDAAAQDRADKAVAA